MDITTSHNELSVASALAAEILGLIFAELAHISPIDMRTQGETQTLGWVVATHVSRRWRYAAIDYATLWADLDLNYCRLWPTFLERSRDTLLFIKGEWGASTDERCWSLIAANIHRVRCLAVSNIGAEDMVIAREMLHDSLPNMHTLRICSRDDAVHGPDAVLPPDFLSRITPRIVHVQLEYMGFPLGASVSLRSLDLCGKAYSNSRISNPASHCLEEILDTLRQLPSLESLVLKDVLPATTMNEALSGQPIVLHNLKKVCLEDIQPLCIDLCFVLDLHPMADVSIYCRSTARGVALQRLWKKMTQLFTRDAGDKMQLHSAEVVARTNETSTMVLGFSALGTRPGMTFDAKRAYTPRCFTASLLHIERATWRNSLLPSTPFSTIKHIRFGTLLFQRPVDEVRYLMKSAVSVTSLEFLGESTLTAIMCMSPRGQEDALLPSLRELTLQSVSCHQPTRSGDVTTTVFEALNEALDQRYRRHGWSLSSITFKSCTIEASSLAQLKLGGRWGGETRIICVE